MTLSTIIEILAVVAGLAQGVLIMLNKKSNWIFYIAQMVLLVIFSTINHLWGDVAMNTLFIAYGVYGMISWNRETDGNGVTILTIAQTLKTVAATLFLWVISYVVLTHTNDPLPVLDSITTAGGLVATFLMVKHKLETWIVWFVVDVLYVAQYWLLPNQALYLMTLNIVWTVMAVISYISWKRLYDSKTVIA
jgi:nicotinamide mononucleotide transporter